MYHGIKWQKKPSGIWKKGQDEGIERGNGVGDVGKEEREREGERNEIHFYLILLGIRIFLQKNSTNE